MTTLMDIELTCPNCGNAFEVTIWGSTNSFGGQTTDFRVLAAGMQPLAFEMHTCPRCAFTGLAGAYDGQQVDESVSTLIAERLAPLVRDEHTMPWRSYEYAAWIAEWRGRRAVEIADLYLRAGWCCADAGVERNTDSETYYRRQAAEHFQRSLDTGDAEGQTPVITYLVAEQLRRVGESQQANAWYERAIALLSEVGEGSALLELAKQQRTTPQEIWR